MGRRESRGQLQDYGADTMARLPTRPQPRCPRVSFESDPGAAEILPRLRRPELAGVDIVVLHLEVQGLVVGAEEPRRLALSCSRAWHEGPSGSPGAPPRQRPGRPSPSGRPDHPRNAVAHRSRGPVSS